MTEKIRNCALTIAGSDSGGNAGVQADLRAFHAYGVHGCTVMTALTAQNPFGVSAIYPVSGDFVKAQLKAVLGTYAIGALKTGMLATAEVIEAVADELDGWREIMMVIDPVMIATSGAKLINDDAIATLKEKLIPLATVITPNLMEAKELTGLGSDDGETLAKALYDKFGVAAMVKGGHSEDRETAADTIFDGKELTVLKGMRVAAPVSTHGTGCSLAAAMAAALTKGMSVKAAAASAKEYVFRAIRDSYYVGEKCGVLGFERMM